MLLKDVKKLKHYVRENTKDLYSVLKKLLENIEAAADALDSANTLYTYQDEAIAFVEEPFSDWFAAIFDLETGLFCYIEYDE